MKPSTPKASKSVWTGRVISAILTILLLLDAVMKFLKPDPVVEGTLKLGYEEPTLTLLGAALLGSTILYAVPQTAALGAVLLTGYLGGAVAAHLRVGDPLFSHTLFPVYLGALIWVGLYLRDERVRSVLPLRHG